MPKVATQIESIIALTSAGKIAEADKRCGEILKKNPDHFDLLHIAGVIKTLLNHHDSAIEYFNAAIKRDPSAYEVYRHRAKTFKIAGRIAEALADLEKLLTKNPLDLAALCEKGILLRQQERYEAAANTYAAAIKLDPQNQGLLADYALLLQKSGKVTESITAFDNALAISINNPVLFFNKGNACQALNRHEEALKCYEQALALKPDFYKAHNNRGNALRSLQRTEEALANYDAVLKKIPNNPEALNNKGAALRDLGRPSEALECLARALAQDPDYADAHINCGNAFSDLGQYSKAISCYETVIRINPSFVSAHTNLGHVLARMEKQEEALKKYETALSINPDFEEALFGRLTIAGHIDSQSGRRGSAKSNYLKALTLRPADETAYSNWLFFCALDPALDPGEYLANARGWEMACISAHDRDAAKSKTFLQTPLAGRRLRVGYVSGDFRRHAVATFIEPVFANHDKTRIEIYCYYNNALRDEVTNRFAAYADHWVDCLGLPDRTLAERIFADGIDILVDLAGHSALNRLSMFALKPAPIQITYLGYPGTSGLTAIDYRLTDAYADPPGSDACYTETLLRLPDSLCCYRPSQAMPEITASPAQENGYVTFGSFNSFNKVNDPCVELWARILRAVPASRLLMLTVPEGLARQRLTEHFGVLGVTGERLEFCGKLTQTDFFLACRRADIALDPIAVTGGTTTCESLWLGIPVVVQIGERFRTRVGYSFLNAAGMSEFAAETAEDYVRIATNLAHDLPRLAETRAGLRARMASSSLVDEAGFTRNLEKIYLEIWDHWYNKTT